MYNTMGHLNNSIERGREFIVRHLGPDMGMRWTPLCGDEPVAPSTWRFNRYSFTDSNYCILLFYTIVPY